MQLLSKPFQVNPASSVMNVEAHFDPEEGELTFKSMLS